MSTCIKPGQIVKHYSNALHYGLQMEVLAVNGQKIRVSFINIYGRYEELWIDSEELEFFEEEDFPFMMSNS